MRPFVPLAFASQVRPGRGKRLLGQWREDMGAVCVDAAPVGFMGMADHAASAELLTASCYDKLEVACSASGGQHKWCIARGKCVRRLRAVAPDRKSVMHRTASASRTQCWVSAKARRRAQLAMFGSPFQIGLAPSHRRHVIVRCIPPPRSSRPDTRLLRHLRRSGWHRRQPPRKLRSTRRSRSC